VAKRQIMGPHRVNHKSSMSRRCYIFDIKYALLATDPNQSEVQSQTGSMDFNRLQFQRPGLFSNFRRDPQPINPTQPQSTDPTLRLPSPSPSTPAAPVLTRPRAGGIEIRPRRDQVDDLPSPGTTDSLTLKDLKNAAPVKEIPKPKVIEHSTLTRRCAELIRLL
jgi:hypothetical protein